MMFLKCESGQPKVYAAEPAASSGRLRLLAALLVLAALMSYLNSFTAPFIFDDRKWIIDDPQVRDLAADWQRLDVAQRPLLFLSLAVNYQLGHLDVRGYHLFNFVIHAIAGLLLFGIVRRTIQRYSQRHGGDMPATGLGFAIALLWLVHPLQTESVTYVIQRCESMMGMFFLLCLYCVIRGSQAARRWPWYTVAIVACVAGCGCKEVMVTAPPIILLYDRAFLAPTWRKLSRRRGWLYLLFFAIAFALTVVMLPAIQGGAEGSVGFSDKNSSAWEYLQSQPGVLLHYLRLAFWPHPLCLDYHWQPAASPAQVYPPATAITALLLLSVIAFRYRPWLGFLGLSFFVVLAPSSSIVPIKDLAVEHRMYIPLAAVAVSAVMFWFGLTERFVKDPVARRLARIGPAALAVLVLMGLTLQRNRDYCVPLRMWFKVVQAAPHNPRGHFSLGATYNLRGDYQRAKDCFEKAISLAPDYAKAHGNLGIVLIRQGEVDRGEYHLRRALELKPNYANALVNLGNLSARGRQWKEALLYYRQALQIEPYHAQTHQNLARVLLSMGKPHEAVSVLSESLRLSPHSLGVRLQLAWVLATCADDSVRDGEQALRLAEEALTLAGDQQPQVLDILAAAYAEAGRYEEACQAASRSLEIAKVLGLREGLQNLADRVSVYRNRKPFRDDSTASAVSTVSTTPNEDT